MIQTNHVNYVLKKQSWQLQRSSERMIRLLRLDHGNLLAGPLMDGR